MNFDQLFKKRLAIYNKRLIKYARYVFNDSFLIVLLLIIGAGGFVYSGYVQTLNPENVIPSMTAALLMTVILQIGRIGLLLEPADTVFILPKEKAYVKALKKLTVRSYLLHLIPLFITAMVSMPVFARNGLLEYSGWIWVFITLAGWKWAFMSLCLYHNQKTVSVRSLFTFLAFFIFSFLGLLLTVFISPVAGTTVSITAAVLSLPLFFVKKEEKIQLDWELMIEKEQNRKQVVYQFFNMFTDVPFVSSKTRRLAFLDPIIKLTSPKSIYSQEYYLRRVLFRNVSYSGLVIRLILVGGIILFFTNNRVLAYIVSLLFNYLIAFQLVPLGSYIDRTLQFSFNPVNELGKYTAVRNIILQVSIFVSILFTIIVIPRGLEAVIGVIGLNFTFSIVFCFFYLPKKLVQD